MRNAVNAFVACCGAALLQIASPGAANAQEDGGEPQGRARQVGENLWVASLAITGGASFQNQDGSGDSFLFEDMGTVPVVLQPATRGDDLVITPFVGASLELMAPALPVPTRPRFFASGEILPSFASTRSVAVEGDPGCIRGADPLAPCARDEQPGQRVNPFGENAANGQGTEVTSEFDLLVFGANLGAAFPFQVGERQLRVKPSVAWISYEVQAEGKVSDAACRPTSAVLTQCTDVYAVDWMPPQPPLSTGFLRETILTASGSERFHGIGPGLDLEVDTGRFGPIATSLFLGARVYRVLGDRTIAFGTSQAFADELGMDVATANFEVEVDPWLYRAHVGIRLGWLGSRD